MPQYWTAHTRRSSLTRSLWPIEAYIVGTGLQTMPRTMPKRCPVRWSHTCQAYLAKKEATKQKPRPKRKQRTTRRKPGTQDAPPLAAWTPCTGNYCMYSDIVYDVYVQDGAYLHFATRMRPLSPNRVKRLGPHPERCPALSDN